MHPEGVACLLTTVMSIIGKLGLAPLALLIILPVGLPALGQQDKPVRGTLPATASLPDLTPDTNGALSQEQMQRLFRCLLYTSRCV